MSTSEEHSTDALTTASEVRLELKEAVSRTERSVAAPIAMPSWRDYVLDQVLGLQIALEQHVEEVERPGGLLAELRELSPRLTNKVDKVQNEHPPLCRAVDDVIRLLQGDADADEVRRVVLEVLFEIVRHRQHGADLVFEGYNVDIGGG